RQTAQLKSSSRSPDTSQTRDYALVRATSALVPTHGAKTNPIPRGTDLRVLPSVSRPTHTSRHFSNPAREGGDTLDHSTHLDTFRSEERRVGKQSNATNTNRHKNKAPLHTNAD